MHALVIYESLYGNTRRIAQAVARGLQESAEVDIVPCTCAEEAAVSSYDLLVVGGPTHVHGMSRQTTRDAAVDTAQRPDSTLIVESGVRGIGVREWLEQLPPSSGPAATFDTRVDKPALLTGRASKQIAKRLGRVGFDIIAPPESFLVDTDTTLLAGEEGRAESWGRALAKKCHVTAV
ncbi:flavodoxin family protein [Rhodococcoides yunnanense]|uniref:flavodoxin family protein n=1 Tax=Rhodococcoides yunnanense TaxID=278209 RepID=UPI0009320C3B|nr:flavodoxin domain-containing protein [Rhodococcus yunnanensis]